MISLRIATLLWYFFRELLLGKKTLVQAAKTNPGKFLTVVVVVASLLTNVHLLPKIILLADRNIALEKSYKKLQEESVKGHPSEELERAREEIAKLKEEKASGINAPPPKPPPTTVTDDVAWVKSEYDAMVKRESKNPQRLK